MKNHKELKTQLKELIATNRTEQALQLLAKTQLSTLDRDLIILNGRFNKIKDDQRMGILDDKDATKELNKINISLLDLAEKIGTSTENTPFAIPSPQSDKKSNKKILLIAAAVLMAAVVGFFGMKAMGNDNDPPSPIANFEMDKTNCNAPCEVQFTNNSKNADEFLWVFGDGSTSVQANPKHTYTEAKTYSVTLTATSPTGRDKGTKSIQINGPEEPTTNNAPPLPIANFEMNKNTGTAPCEIQFTNNSQNADEFLWEFGDGQISNLPNPPPHKYMEAKTYSVKLTATSETGRHKDIKSLQINAPPRGVPALPIANFKMDKSTCTAPCTVRFTNLSKNASKYKWEINGKLKSRKKDLKYTFDSPAKYSIKLTATSESKTNTYEQFIQVDAPTKTPIAKFKMDQSSGTAPISISFTNLSTNATSFLWEIDNKKISENQNFRHTFSAPGKHSIKLTARNGFKRDTEEQSIRVNAPAPPPSPETGTFVHGGQTYKWNKMKDGKNWMTQNLNYKTSDSWCYNNDDSNCKKYGRLYNWEAAKKACPKGWHLPTNKEWETLASFYGGFNKEQGGQGEKLRDTKLNYSKSGFNPSYAGFYDLNGFYYIGVDVHYWANTESDSGKAIRFVFGVPPRPLNSGGHPKVWGFSCRCVGD